ncbi:MAG: hypothetical protein ACOH5I_09850 [Oligoflexus sp.]
MLTEPLPIRVFVRTNLERSEVKHIVEHWRVDFTVLIQLICNHFHDMGWYEVRPELEKVARKTMVMILKSSSDILIKVAEAERRERMLARTKRSFAD